jgi:hypothetical protein
MTHQSFTHERTLRLPQILAEIMRQLQLVNAELLEIPAHRCEDPRREVLILLRDFTKKVSKHVDGLPPPASNDPLDPASQGLIQAINDASERFRVKVHQTAPQFRPWNSNATIGAQQRNSMLATVRVDDADGTAVGPVFHLDEIMDIAKRSVFRHCLSQLADIGIRGRERESSRETTRSLSRRISLWPP